MSYHAGVPVERLRRTVLGIGISTSTAVAGGVIASMLSVHQSLGRLEFIGLLSLGPLFVVFARSAPAVFFGAALMAVQPLEAFEIGTPVVTLSVAVVLLFGLLFARGADILKAVGGSRVTTGVALMIALWAVSHLVQLSHSPANEVFRQQVTLAGYFAVWCAGVWIGRSSGVSGPAVGAAAALLLLGGIAIGAQAGWFPSPTRVSAPRTLLWWTSPFDRSYGLNVGFGTVALLLPLALPTLLFWALRARAHHRAISVSILCLIVLAVVLVFQSRGFLLQLVVGGVLFAQLMVWSSRWIAISIIPVIIIGWIVATNLTSIDQVSSSLRYDGIMLSVDVISNPNNWLFGVSRDDIAILYTERATLFSALHGFATPEPIHNFILAELVYSGIVPFFLFTSIFLSSTKRSYNLLVNHGRNYLGIVPIISLSLVAVVVLLEPLLSNAMPLWLLLGVIWGIPVSPVVSEETSLSSRRIGYVRVHPHPVVQPRALPHRLPDVSR